MTLRELFESGIVIDEYIQIQCWEDEDNLTIYYEGDCQGDIEKYMDREIVCMFSHNPIPYETEITGICISLAKGE